MEVTLPKTLRRAVAPIVASVFSAAKSSRLEFGEIQRRIQNYYDHNLRLHMYLREMAGYRRLRVGWQQRQRRFLGRVRWGRQYFARRQVACASAPPDSNFARRLQLVHTVAIGHEHRLRLQAALRRRELLARFPPPSRFRPFPTFGWNSNAGPPARTGALDQTSALSVGGERRLVPWTSAGRLLLGGWLVGFPRQQLNGRSVFAAFVSVYVVYHPTLLASRS